jgi:hypothetical protein
MEAPARSQQLVGVSVTLTEGNTQVSNYTVRVWLHNAEYKDYEKLHDLMGKAGFSRTLTGSDGVIYRLPDAEYVATTSMSASQVHDVALAAGKQTGRTTYVLVTASTGRTFNLPRAA